MKRIMDNITLVEDTPREYKCDKCKDEGGWVEKRDTDVYGDGRIIRKEDFWIECSCAKQRKLNRLIASSQITPEFQKMKFSNFKGEGVSSDVIDMAKVAKNYCDNYEVIKNTANNSIALMGQPGTGKTHLLTAVSNNLLNKGIAVMYFPFISMMNDIQANQFEKKDEIINRAKRAELLFIDDLYKPTAGTPQCSPFEQKTMYDIINHRYLNKMPILLSCELGFPDLLAVDEATGSRIFEMCQDYAKEIKKDFRQNYRTKKLFGGK